MSTLEATFDPTDKAAPGHYGPSQTALLLLDFHSMFVYKLAGAVGPAALKVAAGMRIWAKAQGILVIHCLIDIKDTPFPTCKGRKRLADTLAAMTADAAEEPADLTEGGGDATFLRKPGHVSAHKSPGLQEYLEEKGIKSLILTGLSTSGCVMRTAVTSCDAEYVTTVISDACTDAGEGVHDMMIGKIVNNRGWVCTAAEFQEGFAKAGAAK